MHTSNIGKTCPYCQFPLKADSEVVVCAACRIPHHRECWQENGGCTTFGCIGLVPAEREILDINIDQMSRDRNSIAISLSKKTIKAVALILFIGFFIYVLYVSQPLFKYYFLSEQIAINNSEIRGNTVGNLVNYGFAAKQDDIIYYLHLVFISPEEGSEMGLYKYDLVTNERIHLNNDFANYINVIDDWLYYVKAGQSLIHKVRTDGTEGINIGNHKASSLYAMGDWLYYVARDEHEEKSSIYKMRTDGSECNIISNDEAQYINVVADWLYYSNRNDDLHIYRIRTDGTGRSKLNVDASSYINVVDGWIYYKNEYDDGKIYRMRTDGSERSRLNDYRSTYINVADGWIYYYSCPKSNDNQCGIYKMRTDGSSLVMLKETNYVELINVVNGWLYFLGGDDFCMMMMRTDGSELQKSQ